MSLKKNLLTFLSLIPLILSAQTNSQNTQQSLVRINPGQMTSSIDLRERYTIVHFFYSDDWRKGKLINKNGITQEDELFIMYDVLNQELSIRMSGKVFTAPPNEIKGFVFMDEAREIFIYETTKDGAPDNTYYELVEDGKYQLLRHHTFYRQKATYVAALDNGDKEAKIYKRAYLYFKGKDGFHKIPKKKKAATKLFESYASAKKYLKKNKVNFKKQKDLIGLVRFMNQEN